MTFALERQGWPMRLPRVMRSISLRVMLGVCLVGAAGCLPKTSDWSRLEPTIPAPDFVLPQLDSDQPVRLSELRGRVVIMEFWATWCGPCRFSTPSLDEIYRQYRDQDVAVLLINEGETDETVRSWVAKRFVAPILMDVTQDVGRSYQVTGIPSLFIVDQQGQIVYVHGGYRGGLEHNLKLILTELLAAGTRPDEAVAHDA